jgi:hypothetical protein
MKTYYVLQRFFNTVKGDFELHKIEAKNDKCAWEIIEEELSENMSQEWLLNPLGLETLKKKINKVE